MSADLDAFVGQFEVDRELAKVFEPVFDHYEPLLRFRDIPEANLHDRVVWQVAVPEAGVDPAAERLDALIEGTHGDDAYIAVSRVASGEDGVDGVVDVEQIVADFRLAR